MKDEFYNYAAPELSAQLRARAPDLEAMLAGIIAEHIVKCKSNQKEKPKGDDDND